MSEIDDLEKQYGLPPLDSDWGNRIPTFTKKKAAEEWVESKFPGLHCKFQLCALGILNPIIEQLVLMAGEFPEVELTALSFVRFPVDRRNQRLATKYLRMARSAKRDGCPSEATHYRRLADDACPNRGVTAWTFRDRCAIEFNARSYESALWHGVNCYGDESSGFRAPGSSDYASEFTHEFGHQVVFWLDKCEDIITVDGERGCTCDLIDEWLESLDLETAVSDFGATDPDQFAAEAFVNYYHSPDPLPVAVETVNHIKMLVQAVRDVRDAQRSKQGGSNAR